MDTDGETCVRAEAEPEKTTCNIKTNLNLVWNLLNGCSERWSFVPHSFRVSSQSELLLHVRLPGAQAGYKQIYLYLNTNVVKSLMNLICTRFVKPIRFVLTALTREISIWNMSWINKANQIKVHKWRQKSDEIRFSFAFVHRERLRLRNVVCFDQKCK